MSVPLSVRKATLSDLDALTALLAHLNPADLPCPPDVAKTAFASIEKLTGSAVLLGFADDVPVTSCTLFVLPNLTRGGDPYALIENVVTHADHRGKGFGKAILQAASAHAFENGCYKAMLLTGSQKLETLRFYEAAGFEQSKTGFQIRNFPARQE